MLLLKTDKARQELMPGVRTLSLRERSLLLLADAKPMQELQAMYHGEGSRIVDELMRAGYLRHPSPTASTNDEPPASQALPLPRSRVPLRSLAGTRMYLFDICERLFARRDPDLAQQFHTALRDARTAGQHAGCGRGHARRSGYLAGTERAAAIRERMNQLLPRGSTKMALAAA
jgi:hypothetical protein